MVFADLLLTLCGLHEAYSLCSRGSVHRYSVKDLQDAEPPPAHRLPGAVPPLPEVATPGPWWQKDLCTDAPCFVGYPIVVAT